MNFFGSLLGFNEILFVFYSSQEKPGRNILETNFSFRGASWVENFRNQFSFCPGSGGKVKQTSTTEVESDLPGLLTLANRVSAKGLLGVVLPFFAPI